MKNVAHVNIQLNAENFRPNTYKNKNLCFLYLCQDCIFLVYKLLPTPTRTVVSGYSSYGRLQYVKLFHNQLISLSKKCQVKCNVVQDISRSVRLK